MNRSELETLLRENVPDITGKSVWIWGAGDTAQLYQEGLRRLEPEGFTFEGYIDRKAARMHYTFHGKPVMAPTTARGGAMCADLYHTRRRYRAGSERVQRARLGMLSAR